MPTTYQKAGDGVLAHIADVMRRWHPRLAEAGVRIGALFAYNPDGPAVKHAGHAVLASIKVVSLRDRVVKEYDAELVIDEREYERLREGQKFATIDHELAHINTVDLTADELKARDEGDGCTWKVDDIGRPKLKVIRGDWDGGDGFDAVVARHGADAIEYELIARCKARADRARSEGERGVS